MRGTATKNRFVTRKITNSDHPLEILNLNKSAHGVLHTPKLLIYGSPDTLATTESSGFYSPYSGVVAWALASVNGAPTSTMEIQVKVGGFSIFEGQYLKILTGDKYSRTKKRPNNAIRIIGLDSPVSAPTPITVKINTIAAATGPLIVVIGVRW